MLTKNQLKQLRKEIVLNSLFIKDYQNTLYINEKTACSFFDSYMEYLYELANDEGFSGDIIDVIKKYDSTSNLYNYYMDSCIDGFDPLIKDGFVASKCLNNSDSIVIYNIVYGVNDYVITGYLYLNGLYMNSTRLTKNKIYYNAVGDPYFIKDKIKYYLEDFIKKNI